MGKEPLYPHVPKGQKPTLTKAVRAAIADEEDAIALYGKLANEVYSLSLSYDENIILGIGASLESISEDERRHRNELTRILEKLEVE